MDTKSFDLKLCLTCKENLEKHLFGRELKLCNLEKTFSYLKTKDAFLSWRLLKNLKTSKDWIFKDFWVMPSRWEMRTDLKKTVGIFSTLPKKEVETIQMLYKIFKNIEVVSIILRLVDPVNYGIISPPVKYALQGRFDLGWEYADEYVKYLSVLREYKEKYNFERISDVSDALWTLVEGCLRNSGSQCDNLQEFRNEFLTIEENLILEEEREKEFQNKIDNLIEEQNNLEKMYVVDIDRSEKEKEKVKKQMAEYEEMLESTELELSDSQNKIDRLRKNRKGFNADLIFSLKDSTVDPVDKLVHEKGHYVDKNQKSFLDKLTRFSKINKIFWSENINVKPPNRVTNIKDTGEVTIIYVGRNNYASVINVFPVGDLPDKTHAKYFAYLVSSYMNIKIQKL